MEIIKLKRELEIKKLEIKNIVEEHKSKFKNVFKKY